MYNEVIANKERKSFTFDFFPKKDITAACIAMETLYEDSANRLFSVRGWDRNGIEIWADDMLSLGEMSKKFSFLNFWMTKARFGEIQEFLDFTVRMDNFSIKADFYFRRVQ